MSGIYIPGMEMPKAQFQNSSTLYHVEGTIFVYPDGKTRAELSVDYKESKSYPLVPVPEREQILRVLKTERECVSRDCDRNCGKCDLALGQSEILSVYDTLISTFSDPADKEEHP